MIKKLSVSVLAYARHVCIMPFCGFVSLCVCSQCPVGLFFFSLFFFFQGLVHSSVSVSQHDVNDFRTSVAERTPCTVVRCELVA